MKLKSLLSILSLIILTVFFSGCPSSKTKYPYFEAYFPKKPVNISDVNSKFDDFNSILAETHFGRRLVFSSNRMTDSTDFNIYDGNFFVVWDWETGILSFQNEYHYGYENFVAKLVLSINNQGNQFGPYSISTDTFIENHQNHLCYLFYSTNSGSEIYRSEFLYYQTPDDGITGEVKGPFTIPFLGDVQQQYISFFDPETLIINNWSVEVNNFTELYFDQTNGESSDLFKITIPDTLNFLDFLTSEKDYEKVPVNTLNTNSDERCPFVNGPLMVFASNREGGFGGYDLYYSKFENGEWQAPVNFGEDINTPYDEFRPITVFADQFKNDLMIFSSNRPGGMGGFDLYFVGIDKITDPLPYQ